MTVARGPCSALVVAAAIGVAQGAAAPSGPPPPGGGHVVFVRYSAKVDHPQLFVVSLAGERPRRLRLPVPAADNPAVSPDGRSLAFVGGVNQPGEPVVSIAPDIYAGRLGRGPYRRLTHDPSRETGPAWSPDGRRLAFSRAAATGNRSSLWIVEADGRGARRLTFGNVDLQPSWAPDGSRLVFVRIDSVTRQSGVWEIRNDGTGLRRLEWVPSGATRPLWASDGKRLLLSDGLRLLVVAPGGSRRVVVRLGSDARGGYVDPEPSGFPTRGWIVFTQNRPGTTGHADVFRILGDGKGLARLTVSPGLDTDPSVGR